METDFNLEDLKSMMISHGARKLFFKILSPNDNSKNQPYFGSDFSSLNIVPTGKLEASDTTSNKPMSDKKRKFKAPVNFSWIDCEENISKAPHAQLILYPQYPEVRFSGFLKNCENAPSELMDSNKRGREPDRVLFLGICNDGHVLGYLASPESLLAKETIALKQTPESGVFCELSLADNSREKLLGELRRIHELGWIKSKRLHKSGKILECKSSNCGGYTLEAELGISANGYAEPDYLGWEIKQHGGNVLTLMTPEPTGGIYRTEGINAFIKKFGYPDKNGVANRLNFGGLHKYHEIQENTGLRLELLGYEDSKITDVNGGVALLNAQGEIAAIWNYSKLIEIWKKKHSRAVYISSQQQKQHGFQEYCYDSNVLLCKGTDILKLLEAIKNSNVYYDPGIKMENVDTDKPKVKRRSQFRLNKKNIGSLYRITESVDVAE